MNELGDSIEICLENKAFFGALFIALTIPDICVSIKEGKRGLGEKYIQWFNENMPTYASRGIPGKICWAFRCAALHQGTDDVTTQDEKYFKDVFDKFVVLTEKSSSHFGYLGGNYNKGVIQPRKMIINIHTFCKDIIEAAKLYISQNKLDDTNLIKFKEHYDDGFISIH